MKYKNDNSSKSPQKLSSIEVGEVLDFDYAI
jgi:hypothetical protein